jgi:competence protein ComEC
MTGGAVLDFRLVPAAVSVWAVVLAGLCGGWQVAALCGLIATLVAGAVLLRWRWHRVAAGVIAAAALAAAAAGGLGLRMWQVAEHPLRAAAERGDSATIRVEVTDRPRPVRATGFGSRPGVSDRVVVPGTLRSARVAGTSMDTGGLVVLVAPAALEHVAARPGGHRRRVAGTPVGR